MKKLKSGIDISRHWKVHVPNLFKEILNSNDKMGIFQKPFEIFARILNELAEEALRVQDPKILAICARLALFAESDPESPDYDKEKINELMELSYSEDYINRE